MFKIPGINKQKFTRYYPVYLLIPASWLRDMYHAVKDLPLAIVFNRLINNIRYGDPIDIDGIIDIYLKDKQRDGIYDYKSVIRSLMYHFKRSCKWDFCDTGQFNGFEVNSVTFHKVTNNKKGLVLKLMVKQYYWI